MKLGDFYKAVVEKGIESDPRGKDIVREELKKTAEVFKALKPEEKKSFDEDKLFNPYADTRVLNGSLNSEIKTVMVGVDIDSGDLAIADRLSEKGKKIDLVMAHHPSGKAYANFYEVMGMQSELFHQAGIPINVAENTMGPRMKDVERRVMPSNHTKTVDAAKLLGLNMMCAHTVADNHVASYLTAIFAKKKPETLKDILGILNEIEEYKISASNNAGPKIFTGSESSKCGKIYVDMTGGTEGPKEIYEAASKAGFGTFVGMHYSEDHRKEIKKNFMNIVVAGHISSDNLGLNLLLDAVMKQRGKLEILECSGYRRVSRSK
ncbi:MAG: NGG1p interacting factor NIF3 [Candidatus Firestonebacteria bacterium RIFOXYC2_FULL_39_67]|nr:MAG: NGG1p interacting factor NIF3 [Candidatus Firestonebacteria bacterium RIFOXYD2_FULL_39_29]OGF54905.1 MAG: NGG1p interacting factor NIF3 [Candidatus Firestonebacteria bacterium RIFOXYC2_FULL_39_67]OGF57748.1 MAG: NGG1p interacting factor NIF3 [Candidatus Firestonebacteria bacterium RifOxyC12_full_39_7]